MRPNLLIALLIGSVLSLLPAQQIDTTLYLSEENVPMNPQYIVLDSAGNTVYVTGDASNHVLALDGTSLRKMAAFFVGAGAKSLCFNPVNRKIYCSCQNVSSVLVIDGTTHQIRAHVPVGQKASDLCYNWLDNKVYCANYLDYGVTVIDGASDSVIATVRVDWGPVRLCYCPTHDCVYTSNQGSASLSVIDGAGDSLLTQIHVAAGTPRGLCYDPLNDRLYYGNGDDQSTLVDVIQCARDSLVAELHFDGGALSFMCLDSFRNRLCCALNSNYVSLKVVDCIPDTLLRSIDLADHPAFSAVYVPASDMVCWPVSDGHLVFFDCRTLTIAARIATDSGACELALGLGRLFCANSTSSSVTVFDPITDSLLERASLAACPAALYEDPVSARLYCAEQEQDDWNVVVYDCRTNRPLKTIPVAPQPVEFAVRTGYDYLFLSHLNSSVLTVLSLTGDSLVAEMETGHPVQDFTFDRIGTRLYCLDFRGGIITVIDPGTGSVLDTIPVGRYPRCLYYDTTSEKLYCANSGGGDISVISAPTDSVVATVYTGGYPLAFCSAPSAGSVLCANYLGGTLTVLDARSDTIRATIPVGVEPISLFYDPERAKVYCPNSGSGTVSVVSPVSNHVLKTLRVGASPSVIAAGSTGTRLYCLNKGSGSVSAIDPETDSVVRTLSTGTEPTAATTCLATARTYVANRLSATISVIQDIPAGIADAVPVVHTAVALSLSPNPSSGVLDIRVRRAGSALVPVMIRDATGRQVRVLDLPASIPTRVDLRDLPPGVYFAAEVGAGRHSVKFVLNR